MIASLSSGLLESAITIFQRYWQRVNTSVVNVRTKNGIIHILSAGHDFGFSKFTSKYSTQ